MADFTSKFAYRYRKGIAATSVGVRTSATQADASVPTITAGAGNPTALVAVCPNGSVYLKTDASNGDDSLWMMIGDSWQQIKGQTA